MISSIQGVFERAGPDWVDVSIGGVTLRVSIPHSAVDQLGERGERVRLSTSLQVREDSLTLYGFLTEDARLAFEALIGISGVGPRLALSVLSSFTPESLGAAVSSGDADAFSAVPGVGKKTAGRIVLELRGTLGEEWAVAVAAGEHDELIRALTSLGYTALEARQAVSFLPAGDAMSLDDKVRLALQHMGTP
jgi:Holliday junction DNA helicase RuvA